MGCARTMPGMSRTSGVLDGEDGKTDRESMSQEVTQIGGGQENQPLASGHVVEESLQGNIFSRLTFLVLAIIPSGILVLASQLTPNPIGHSTHTQLGLPPCGFLQLTGVICPGCGLTTSFSHLVRFELVDAANANPFGIPLFIFALVSIPLSITGAIKGWSLVDALIRFRMDIILVGLAMTGVVVWIVRLVVPAIAGLA